MKLSKRQFFRKKEYKKMNNKIEGKSEIPNTSEILLFKEKSAWRSVLGVDVEILPLPSVVTPEVKGNLGRLGFGLRYIPALDLEPDSLRQNNIGDYLKKLNKRYPNWKPFESLSDKEKSDHSVPRNLEEFFWEQIKKGQVDLPKLSGFWLAIETMPKPSYRDSYERTAVADKLGLFDRFSVIWNDIQAAIQKAKRGILSEARLPSSLEVRMLEVYEWNLLANREGWGATESYEWTNTEFRRGVVSDRIVVGTSIGGYGAAFATSFSPERSLPGFRLAIVLGS